MREKLLHQIKELTQHQLSVNIYGPNGIGKTYVLEQLNGIKLNAKITKEELQRITGKNGTINQLMQELTNMECTTIKIDNCNKPTNKQIETIRQLKHEHPLIIASETPINIDELVQIEVQPITTAESKELISDGPFRQRNN